MRLAVLPLLFALGALGSAQSSPGPCKTTAEAKAIAESDTSGEAVSARRVIQTDGTKGFEVLVHMPGKKMGWRCIIDEDLAKVRHKDAIRNPPSKAGHPHK